MSGEEEAVRLAARVIVDAALDLIEGDPHSFSTRPCQSCRAITHMIGRNFGCMAVAAGEWRHYKPQPKPSPSD
jgi:hypothetical protein